MRECKYELPRSQATGTDEVLKASNGPKGPPTVTFLEQYYYPEGWGGAQLPRDVTIDWAQAGHRVVVVCGSEQYAKSEDHDVVDPGQFGVRIRRIPALIRGDVRTRKVLRQLWFLFAAVPVMTAGGRPRVLVTQTNPPVTVLLTALLAKTLRRPYVIIAQDLYPEVIFAHGMIRKNSLLARCLQLIFDRAYAHASAVVSLGPRMSEKLVEKGVRRARIQEISNWATGNLQVLRGKNNELLSAWGLERNFVLVYSGNLGIAHDYETLIRAIGAARESAPQIKLVFIGGGTRTVRAKRLVQELELENAVLFKPFVPFEKLPNTFGIANVSVVSLLPGFEGLVVPSKLFGNMARAVPTLYIGPQNSDVDVILRVSGGGFSTRNGDQKAVTDCILSCVRDPGSLEQMGQAARRYYQARLSKPLALEKYRKVLDRCLMDDGMRQV